MLSNFIERDDFDYRDYVVVSGVAKVAKESIVYNTSEYFGVSFVIDRETHCVVESDFNAMTEMHNEYLRKIVKGFCMDEPIDLLLQKIKSHVYIGISGAILQAIRNLAEKYKSLSL